MKPDTVAYIDSWVRGRDDEVLADVTLRKDIFVLPASEVGSSLCPATKPDEDSDGDKPCDDKESEEARLAFQKHVPKFPSPE